jgi:hypothetical protein
VAVPWIALSGSFLSEPVAYPAFAWAVLGMQRTLAAPSPKADALALGGLLLAFVARTQFYLLAIVLLLAVAVHEVVFRRSLRDGLVAAVRGHLVLVAAAALALLVGTATGTWSSVLGNYATVQNGTLLPAGTWGAGRELLDYVVVGIGIVPLVGALAWAAVSLVRPAGREQHAYAVLLAGITAALVLAIGSFSVRFTAGPNDRYVFYLVPLLFLGLAALLLDRRRLTIPLLASGVVAALLVHAGRYTLQGPSMTSPSAAFHTVLTGHTQVWGRRLGISSLSVQDVLAAAAVATTVALVAARRFLPHRAVAWAAMLVVGGYCVGETLYTLDKVAGTQKTADRKAALAAREFLDAKVPDGQKVGLILGVLSDPATTSALYWDASFWNKSAGRTYRDVESSNYDQGFTSTFDVDPATGAVRGLEHGGERYLAQSNDDRRFGLAGARVLDAGHPLHLLQAPKPYRVAWTMTSTDGTGRTPLGSRALIRVYPPAPGARRASVELTVTTTFHAPRAFAYRLRADGGAARSGVVKVGQTVLPRITVRLPPGGGPARVSLRPAEVRRIAGAPPDAGLHVLNVGVRAE